MILIKRKNKETTRFIKSKKAPVAVAVKAIDRLLKILMDSFPVN